MGDGKKRERSGDGNYEVNTKDDVNFDIGRNDVGGEDRGPCSPAMPRGCVACVACRTRTCLSPGHGRGGFELSPGRV